MSQNKKENTEQVLQWFNHFVQMLKKKKIKMSKILITLKNNYYIKIYENRISNSNK